MTEPGKNAHNAAEARREAAEYQRRQPDLGETAPAEDAAPKTPIREEVRRRILFRHKGDVGLPGTNEEIYQGSKQKELK